MSKKIWILATLIVTMSSFGCGKVPVLSNDGRLMGEDVLNNKNWQLAVNPDGKSRLINRHAKILVTDKGEVLYYRPRVTGNSDAIYPDGTNFTCMEIEFNKADKEFIKDCFVKTQTKLTVQSLKPAEPIASSR